MNELFGPENSRGELIISVSAKQWHKKKTASAKSGPNNKYILYQS